MGNQPISLEPAALAVLPITQVIGRSSPFDRYRDSECELPESQRKLVNAAVRAYQMHTYHVLVHRYFGIATRQAVLEHQFDILKRTVTFVDEIKDSLTLISEALRFDKDHVYADGNSQPDPIELSIARFLAYVAGDSTDRGGVPRAGNGETTHIDSAVCIQIARYLKAGKDEIIELFVPMFKELAESNQ